MNYKMMGRFMAQILSIEGVFMIPALIISFCCGDAMAVWGFLYTLGIAVAVAGGLLLACKGAPSVLNAKEGLVCVALSWIVMSLLGSLPFWFSRSKASPALRRFADRGSCTSSRLRFAVPCRQRP